ncbi:MAG: hypothetical protein WBQ69_10690 [Gallionella sp.]
MTGLKIADKKLILSGEFTDAVCPDCFALFEIEDSQTVTVLAMRHQREEDFLWRPKKCARLLIIT